MDFTLMLEEAWDESEREGILLCEACDISVAKAQLALDTFSKMTELDARARLVRAKASGDDLDSTIAFYEEDNAKAAENDGKKKNLIARLWDAIIKAWTTFWDTVTGKYKNVKGDANKKVKAHKGILGFVGKIKELITKVKDVISSHAKEGIIAAGVALTALIATVKGVFKPKEEQKAEDVVETTEDKIARVITDLVGIQAEVKALAEEAKKAEEKEAENADAANTGVSEADGKTEAQKSLFGKIANMKPIAAVREFLKEALANIKEFTTGIWKKFFGKDEAAEGENKEGENKEEDKPAEKAEEPAAEASSEESKKDDTKGESAEEDDTNEVIEESWEAELDRILAGTI